MGHVHTVLQTQSLEGNWFWNQKKKQERIEGKIRVKRIRVSVMTVKMHPLQRRGDDSVMTFLDNSNPPSWMGVWGFPVRDGKPGPHVWLLLVQFPDHQ